MSDYLTAFIGFFANTEHQGLILFISAFLSATLLPGNSEIVFTTFISQALWQNSEDLSLQLVILLGSATIGNSLGSLTTYYLARLVPRPQQATSRWRKWALYTSQRYGVWVLLLSWLPVVGDLFCGIAGWLRFNLWASVMLIMMGKFFRYVAILWGLFYVVG